MDQDLEGLLREVLERQKAIDDRHQIYDRLMAYTRGIDRNDGALVQDTFWPDALVDHGHSKFRGEGIGEIFEEVSKHATRGQCHWIMNIVYEFHGDQAITEAQHLYQAEAERNDVPLTLTRALRYIDRWERREDVWRIFHRTVVETWNRVDPIVERYPPNPNMYLAGTDRNDVSYRLFELTRKNAKPDLELPGNESGTESAEHRTDAAGWRAPTNEFWRAGD